MGDSRNIELLWRLKSGLQSRTKRKSMPLVTQLQVNDPYQQPECSWKWILPYVRLQMRMLPDQQLDGNLLKPWWSSQWSHVWTPDPQILNNNKHRKSPSCCSSSHNNRKTINRHFYLNNFSWYTSVFDRAESLGWVSRLRCRVNLCTSLLQVSFLFCKMKTLRPKKSHFGLN